MTTLTRTREHLREHRRLIIGRSLAAALVGALPVPVVEEWLSATIQRGTVRRVAQNRGVDIDEEGVKAVADGPHDVTPQWAEILSGKLLFRFLTRSWRRVLVVALAARRMQSARDHYLVGTLFDHYCARLHVGMGIDDNGGREVRRFIDRAIAETGGGLSQTVFRRALVAAARTSVRLPFDLLNWASGGAVRRLLKRQGEFEAATDVDAALEKHLGENTSFLARATAAIELSIAAEANPYLQDLVEHFERLWRERHVAKSPA
jgi:hypothetical protein